MNHPVEIYLSSLESERSRITMKRALDYFAQFVTQNKDEMADSILWSEITPGVVQSYKFHLQNKDSPHKPGDKLSANTISVYLSAIRGVLQKSYSNSGVAPEHKVPYEILSEVANNLRNPKIDKSLKGHYIEPRAFKSIINSLDGKRRQLSRDTAILSILYGCGLRCSELCTLSYPEDIDWEQGMLSVYGKGSKRRAVPMFNELEEAIEDWLFHRGESPGPLFLPISRADNVLFREGERKDSITGIVTKRYVRAITPHGVSSILKNACIKAGTKSYKPHDFRRSYITTLFYLETDLLTIQKLVGHESSDTTRRYDLRDLRAGTEAARALGALIRDIN
ncbi:hypothetical protein C9928_05565 [Pseudidiomarina aestuarii]|uniref:Integrase n=1 Tax=Pseudidiomarina aestuarii TaxID=624146 RepID=A0A6N4DGX4_9GAMM|nr:hypothetical protein C9928_05565 [Pseudidiomarina aestuarii]